MKKLIELEAVWQKENYVNAVTDVSIPFVMYQMKHKFPKQLLLTNNEQKVDYYANIFRFIDKNLKILTIPAWDNLPFDRVSPDREIMEQRMKALLELRDFDHGIVVASLAALTQRMPPVNYISSSIISLTQGDQINREELITKLMELQFERSATANEPGEFAVRGSIVDIVVESENHGYRIDFFGNRIDKIRLFDQATQISKHTIKSFQLYPMSEVIFTSETLSNFSHNYINEFSKDEFYYSILSGRREPGIEHYLPLFYNYNLCSYFDYLSDFVICGDLFLENQSDNRFDEIQEYYSERIKFDKDHIKGDGRRYNSLDPSKLYILKDEFEQHRIQNKYVHFINNTNFEHDNIIKINLTPLKPLYIEAREKNMTPIACLKEKIEFDKKQIIIFANSVGSSERMKNILANYDLNPIEISSYRDIKNNHEHGLYLAVLAINNGMNLGNTIFLAEEDIFGEKIYRRKHTEINAENFINEVSSLNVGSLVVHRDHGIGRFNGLVAVVVDKIHHDCLQLIYDNNDKLYIPVENIDLLSHFGDNEYTKLDRLGAGQFQLRKARMKERITLQAEELMRIAALRSLNKLDPVHIPETLYQEFSARFPYNETDDQLHSIDEVRRDFESEYPKERLICGDVGFGKTEVALRSAFMMVADNNERTSKYQVAIVVPTTLLARQHYRTFVKRFSGFPYQVKQFSRLVNRSELNNIKTSLSNGEIDVVIGTHGLLAKNIKFNNLKLLIIDEEQHFGVKQKERLKEMSVGVHTLSLSATPIPRTLQMSLTGLKELSLITTPPVDRLVVKTFVTPFDPIMIREALMREHLRGGKSFYVAPKISDLGEIEETLHKLVPEIRMVKAHGQMPAETLENIMNDFYDGKFDLLLSTSIVESGLDVEGANTIIIHRADHFGLSQLYQIRGRVGRGKIRGYAYLIVPSEKLMTKDALKRLEVMQKLDSLGAGFTVASHDMDIRGFGNLVGEQQSGHIREVGIELYQEMLMDAIDEVKNKQNPNSSNNASQANSHDFSPTINLQIPVLIPDSYISDLDLRLGLYKRISGLKSKDEVDNFKVELIDRFGKYPKEVTNLFLVIHLKLMLKYLNISRLDLGEKGAVFSFHNNFFAKPDQLLELIDSSKGKLKLRNDHKLILFVDQSLSFDKKLAKIYDLLIILKNIIDEPK